MISNTELVPGLTVQFYQEGKLQWGTINKILPDTKIEIIVNKEKITVDKKDIIDPMDTAERFLANNIYSLKYVLYLMSLNALVDIISDILNPYIIIDYFIKRYLISFSKNVRKLDERDNR